MYLEPEKVVLDRIAVDHHESKVLQHYAWDGDSYFLTGFRYFLYLLIFRTTILFS